MFTTIIRKNLTVLATAVAAASLGAGATVALTPAGSGPTAQNACDAPWVQAYQGEFLLEDGTETTILTCAYTPQGYEVSFYGNGAVGGYDAQGRSLTDPRAVYDRLVADYRARTSQEGR